MERLTQKEIDEISQCPLCGSNNTDQFGRYMLHLIENVQTDDSGDTELIGCHSCGSIATPEMWMLATKGVAKR